jgi:hypothetical protein
MVAANGDVAAELMRQIVHQLQAQRFGMGRVEIRRKSNTVIGDRQRIPAPAYRPKLN